MTHWFPLLAAAGLPVPKTEVVDAGADWHWLVAGLDGGLDRDRFDRLCGAVREAAARVGTGYPYFLRTGHTAGKHDWGRTCLLDSPEAVPARVLGLVEFSCLADFLGLPCRYLAVREMLPVTPLAVLPGYRGMPLVPEVRCFVAGGAVRCSHGYWPEGAVLGGLAREAPGRGADARRLHALCGEAVHAGAGAWLPVAARAAAALGGAFSVDLLLTRRGWYVTDCAAAYHSYHEPGCPRAAEFAG